MARRKDLHPSPVTLLLSLRLPLLLLMALDSQVIKSIAPLPGCVIEKNVKYSGNNLSSKRGINQETCALLCFKKPSCTHWTHNPTYQGGKCWLKTSSSGRTSSTTGSTSGQKACGARGFSLPEVTKAAATAVAECQSPWTSVDIPGQPSGCYLFHGFKSSWYDSKRECKQSGGHLVEIGSREEQEALIGELERQGLMGYDRADRHLPRRDMGLGSPRTNAKLLCLGVWRAEQ